MNFDMPKAVFCRLALSIATLLPTSTHAQEGLKLKIERAYNDPGSRGRYRPSIIVSVKNESGRFYSGAIVECSWLKGTQIQKTGEGLLLNLATAARASTTVYELEMFEYDSVSCRISMAY